MSEIATAPAHSVGQKMRRGISWNFAGAIITNVLRLVSVAVLGRVLDPHDFGVVAAALSVMLVLHQVRDIGIGAALVQREHLDQAHITTAFAFSIYIGWFLAAVLVAIAPWIGDVYGIPESVDILRALGVLFVLRGISTVPVMLTRRALNFRAIALIDAMTYGLGAATAMSLAIAGAGPWSLIAGYVVEESASAVAYLSLPRTRPSLRIRRDRLRELLDFGVGHTITQIANILAIHGDNFVVGRSLGAGPLGFYTRAYELIKLPAAVFNNVVGNVLFPGFSRMQSDPMKLSEGFRRATLANALVLLPASAALIVVAPEAIRVVMGEQWDAAVLPFRILALSMLARTSYKVGATVASAAGAVHSVAIANIVYMAAVIGGAAFTIRWGIPGVAASTAVAITLIYILCSWLAMRVSHASLGDVLAAHVPGLLIAGLVGVGTWPVAEALRETGVSAALTFAAIGVLAIGVTIVGLILWMRTSSTDARWLRGELGRFLRKRRAS